MPTATLADARAVLGGAARVLVLTGAGISTASGIPDYRGPRGEWTVDPAAERASYADVYARDPGVRETSWRRLLARRADPAQPNVAHYALAAFEATGRLDLLVTQNIDGLHLAAGSSADRLIEIHGHLREVRCLACEARTPTDEALERVANGESDPRCLAIVGARVCGGVLATTIVRFGESPLPQALHVARHAARGCDVMLCVGSTLTVFPVANLVPLALDYHAQLMIVNAQATDYDPAALCLRGDITEVLPALLAP